MAPSSLPCMHSQDKKTQKFSRPLVSEFPAKSLATIYKLCTIACPSTFPRRTKLDSSSSNDLKGLDFYCKGIEEDTIPKAELPQRGTGYYQFIDINVSTSSSPTTYTPSFDSTIRFPPQVVPSSKISTPPLGSTIPFSPPLITLPKASAALPYSMTIPSFHRLICPPIYPSSSSSSIQSFSTTSFFSQSLRGHWRARFDDEQGFRVLHIDSEKHHIAIKLGTLHYTLPANHLMWHPVGHVVVLRTVFCMGVLNWREYLGLLKHMFQSSAGGIHRFHLEDLGNEQCRIKEGNGVHFHHENGPVEFIDYTWEVRASLVWEKNIWMSLWIIVYNMMKDFFVLFISFVHSVFPNHEEEG